MAKNLEDKSVPEHVYPFFFGSQAPIVFFFAQKLHPCFKRVQVKNLPDEELERGTKPV